MDYQEYINQKKELYSNVIQFFECEKEDADTSFEDLINIIISQKIQGNYNELKLFLKLIIDICCNHSRSNDLLNKFEKIIRYLKENIKKNFTNSELYELTKINNLILLYFIQEKIIHIDSNIIDSFRRNECLYYFYPEIKDKIDADELEQIEKIIQISDPKIFNNFENNRKRGENESYLCSLIRNDSVEEFIIYMNQTNLSVSALINHSLFESNFFLKEKKSISLIQYATFYGSLQIFQYLRLNDVKLDQSLWPYAIHSNNAEIIHHLEDNHIKFNKNLFLLKESIKCHHNAISNYINDNFLNGRPIESNEKFIKCILHHCNFEFFPSNFNTSINFYSLFQYEYKTLVNFYLKEKVPESNNNKILKFIFINTISKKKSFYIIPNF